MKTKTTLKKIVRVDQSPLNPKRWCITMECGHETWVTRERGKPKATGIAHCPRCQEIERLVLSEIGGGK